MLYPKLYSSAQRQETELLTASNSGGLEGTVLSKGKVLNTTGAEAQSAGECL